MALTITPLYKWALSGGRSEFLSIIMVAGDTSGYAGTTGFAITASMFTFNTFASTSDFQLQVPPPNPVFVWADSSHTGAGLGAHAFIDSTTGNLRWFTSAGAEVANGANTTTFQCVLAAYGH